MNWIQRLIAGFKLAPIDVTEHPFAKGLLTSTGVHSAVVSTTDDNYIEVESITIDPPASGTISEVEFGLTAATLSSGTQEEVDFKWCIYKLGQFHEGFGDK